MKLPHVTRILIGVSIAHRYSWGRDEPGQGRQWPSVQAPQPGDIHRSMPHLRRQKEAKDGALKTIIDIVMLADAEASAFVPL